MRKKPEARLTSALQLRFKPADRLKIDKAAMIAGDGILAEWGRTVLLREADAVLQDCLAGERA